MNLRRNVLSFRNKWMNYRQVIHFYKPLHVLISMKELVIKLLFNLSDNSFVV